MGLFAPHPNCNSAVPLFLCRFDLQFSFWLATFKMDRDARLDFHGSDSVIHDVRLT